MALVPLVLLAPVLIAAAYFDLRDMRIPNWLSLLALALFLVSAAVAPPADLGGRVLAAGVVFVLGFTAFAFRLLGGGDVKLLSVLMLFIPSAGLLTFARLFSAALLLGVLIVVAMRRLPAAQRLAWKTFAAPGRLPAGLPIAMAGLGFAALEIGLGGS